MTQLTVTRKGYTRKDGTRVKASTFKIEDRGKPGRTPKEERWFVPGIETGWEKGQPESVRRAKVLRAHKGDELASARSMQALANVTTDGETANKATRDAKYFYRQHRARQRKPPTVVRKPKTRLMRIHAKRSPQARASDERQSHKVIIEPESPEVRRWIADPSKADISGIDTPSASRRKTPRITPKRPRLRR